jgi:flagellin-specific chaperone FliS
MYSMSARYKHMQDEKRSSNDKLVIRLFDFAAQFARCPVCYRYDKCAPECTYKRDIDREQNILTKFRIQADYELMKQARKALYEE